MKTVIAIFFLLHGLVHLLGFVKAFNPALTGVLSRDISRPAGVLWLLASLLFLWSLSGYLLKREWWPFVAVAGVVLSQVLISLNWADAKYGTLANFFILFLVLFSYGRMNFNQMILKETSALFSRITSYDNRALPVEDSVAVPPAVERWIKNSGISTNLPLKSVRLKQRGKMRTSPGGKWMSFRAVQYFDVQNPAFIWITKVNLLPLIHLDGRDKLLDGEGEMMIKAASLVKVVDERKNEKINSGSMLRFLAEMCWFPAAAKSQYISWKVEEVNSARATLKLQGEEVNGTFRFSEDGDVLLFEAFRYMGSDEKAKKELWIINVLEHKTFDGVRIPAKLRVTWKLAEGDFTWLELEVTALDYNVMKAYENDVLVSARKKSPRAVSSAGLPLLLNILRKNLLKLGSRVLF